MQHSQLSRPVQPSAPPAPALHCVAVPILQHDLRHNLESVFRLWSDPRFRPVSRPETRRPVLLVMLNRGDEADLALAREIYARHPDLGQSFAGFSVRCARLDGDRDLYVRDAHAAQGVYGNKAGPNFLFQRTIESAAHFGGFTLQIELDCLPVQAGWIEATNAVIAANARAWVIGSTYAGARGIDPSVQGHLNGNAIYHSGDPAFLRFLATIWMPRLLSRAQQMPNLAYDCWWEVETAGADAWQGNPAWQMQQRYGSFFRDDPFVVNLLADHADLSAFAAVYGSFARLGRPPIFLHGQPMAKALAVLLEHSGDSVFQALDRLAPPGPGRVAPPRVPMPAPGPPMPLDLVLGFHAIAPPDPRFGPGRVVWTATPRVFLGLPSPAPELRLRFHVNASAPPPLMLTPGDSDAPLPTHQSWDPTTRRGTLAVDTRGLAANSLLALGPRPVTTTDAAAPDPGLPDDLTVTLEPGDGLLLIEDGLSFTACETLCPGLDPAWT